jgi:hypothetical protein
MSTLSERAAATDPRPKTTSSKCSTCTSILISDGSKSRSNQSAIGERARVCRTTCRTLDNSSDGVTRRHAAAMTSTSAPSSPASLPLSSWARLGRLRHRVQAIGPSPPRRRRLDPNPPGQSQSRDSTRDVPAWYGRAAGGPVGSVPGSQGSPSGVVGAPRVLALVIAFAAAMIVGCACWPPDDLAGKWEMQLSPTYACGFDLLDLSEDPVTLIGSGCRHAGTWRWQFNPIGERRGSDERFYEFQLRHEGPDRGVRQSCRHGHAVDHHRRGRTLVLHPVQQKYCSLRMETPRRRVAARHG